jgi:hypothetical protein
LQTPLDVLEGLGFYRFNFPERYPTSIDSVFTEISEQPVGLPLEDQNIFFFGILYREYRIDTLENSSESSAKNS